MFILVFYKKFQRVRVLLAGSETQVFHIYELLSGGRAVQSRAVLKSVHTGPSISFHAAWPGRAREPRRPLPIVRRFCEREQPFKSTALIQLWTTYFHIHKMLCVGLNEIQCLWV